MMDDKPYTRIEATLYKKNYPKSKYFFRLSYCDPSASVITAAILMGYMRIQKSEYVGWNKRSGSTNNKHGFGGCTSLHPPYSCHYRNDYDG